MMKNKEMRLMEKWKRILAVFVALTLMLPAINVNAATKRITLNATSVSTYVGKTVKLKVKEVKSKDVAKKISWKTSNSKVATVSKDGKVTPKKAGTVTVTATLKANKKVSAKCKIKVYKATKQLQLNSNKSVCLIEGDTIVMDVSIKSPASGAQPIAYSSSNKKIATVDKKGKIKAISVGTAKIKAVSGGKSVSITVIVCAKGLTYQYADNVNQDLFSANDYKTTVDQSNHVLVSVPSDAKVPQSGEYITIPSEHGDLIFRVSDVKEQFGGENYLQIEVPQSIEDVYSDLVLGETVLPTIKDIVPAEGVTINSIKSCNGTDSNDNYDVARLQSFSLDRTEQYVEISGSCNVATGAAIGFVCRLYPADLIYDSKSEIMKFQMPYEIIVTNKFEFLKLSDCDIKLFEGIVFDFETVLSVQASIGLKLDVAVGMDNDITFEGVLAFETNDGKTENCSTASVKTGDNPLKIEVKVGPYIKCGLYTFKEEIDFINDVLNSLKIKHSEDLAAKSIYYVELDTYIKTATEHMKQDDGIWCESIRGDLCIEIKGASEMIKWLRDFSYDIKNENVLDVHLEDAVPVKYCKYKPFSLNTEKLKLFTGIPVTINAVTDAPSDYISWEIGDDSVAKIENYPTGKFLKVTGVKAGKTTITCHVGKKQKQCEVLVAQSIVTLSIDSVKLKEGETLELTAETNSSSMNDIKWSVSDKKTVSLSNTTGKKVIVKGLAGGTADVICKVGNKTVKCVVTVKATKKVVSKLSDGSYMTLCTKTNEKTNSTIYSGYTYPACKKAEIKGNTLVINGAIGRLGANGVSKFYDIGDD